jgi:signal transduction histidine kinase
MLDGEFSIEASALRQVVLNLLLNAIQASPEGGHLIFLATVESEHLLLEVHDEGPGINTEAEAVLSGESPKPAPIGEGSGLGLWMTRRLLQDLRGRAMVGVSRLGGALVQVRVPLAPAEELRDVA